MTTTAIEPKDIVKAGLTFVGWPENNRRNDAACLQHFLDHFGADPIVVLSLLSDFQTTDVQAARIEKPSLRYFLMALFWLKCYDTESRLCSRWNTNEKTMRKWIRTYVNAMAALKEIKVRRPWWVGSRDLDAGRAIASSFSPPPGLSHLSFLLLLLLILLHL